MALTKPAGWAMQILSIPFIAIGFVLALTVVMTIATGTAFSLPTAIGAAVTLGLGVLMLRSGKRATAPPKTDPA